MSINPENKSESTKDDVLALNKILGFGFILISGVSLILHQAVTKSQKQLFEQQERHATFRTLVGEIGRLDETLTMSAKMAAATRNPIWETRYNHFDPILARTIKNVLQKFPELSATRETDLANQKLVEMERKSFSLVRDGKSDLASALLISDEYETQKAVYSRGMEESQNRLSELLLSHQASLNSKTSFLEFAQIILLIATLIGAILLFRRERRHF